MTTLLKGSVGDKKADGTLSENIRSDVMKVQMPLSTLIEHHRLMVFPPLELTATITKDEYDSTIMAIRGYQQHVLGVEKSTGRIDQGYEDLQKLQEAATRVTAPSKTSPNKTQTLNKLKQLLHCDELSYYQSIHDPNGTIKCILSKLVNLPDVDDSFIGGKSVQDYLDFSGVGAIPSIDHVNMIKVLSNMGLPSTTEQTFLNLKEAVLDLLDGIIKARQVDVYSRTVEGGAGAAVARLESWMVKQSNKKNSIYSCCKPQFTSPDGFWGKYV